MFNCSKHTKTPVMHINPACLTAVCISLWSKNQLRPSTKLRKSITTEENKFFYYFSGLKFCKHLYRFITWSRQCGNQRKFCLQKNGTHISTVCSCTKGSKGFKIRQFEYQRNNCYRAQIWFLVVMVTVQYNAILTKNLAEHL